MASHTPGPWGVEQTHSTNWIGPMRCDGKKIDTIVVRNYRDGLRQDVLERNDANARLIAAAPRMKDALFRTLKYLEMRSDGESNELWGEVAEVLSEATQENVE